MSNHLSSKDLELSHLRYNFKVDVSGSRYLSYLLSDDHFFLVNSLFVLGCVSLKMSNHIEIESASKGRKATKTQLSVGFSETPNNETPYPYYSHTTPIRTPKDMGIVWDAYHKGVPLLGVPGINLDCRVTTLDWGC